MNRLAQVLAEVDLRAAEPTRNPEAQRRAFNEVLRVFTEHQERFREVWDDVASEKAAPLFTYLRMKVEALG